MAFEPFNLAQTITTASNNKLAMLRMAQEQQAMDETAAIKGAYQEAAKTGQNPVDVLASKGYYKQANELRDMAIKRATEGYSFLEKGAKIVTDQPSYDAFRSRAFQMGIATPQDLPEQYDKDRMSRIGGIATKQLERFGSMEQIPGAPTGTIGQRNLDTGEFRNIRAPEVQRDEPLHEIYDPRSPTGTRLVTRSQAAGKPGKPMGRGRGGDGEDGPGGELSLKSADENAIYAQSGNLFGGMYDPVTGRFSGLDKTTAQKVQSIASRATRLYVQGRGSITRAESVASAARESGIAIPQIGDQPPAASVAPKAQSAAREGATAINPRTGQRIVYRNGQWAPL